MQKHVKVTVLVMASMLFAGCGAFHPLREKRFVVSGKIVATSPAPSSDCEFELRLRKGDRVVEQTSVPREFHISMTIEPGIHDYYMVLRCPGDPLYRTKVYRLGNADYLRNPVDLGEIDLLHAKPADTHAHDN